MERQPQRNQLPEQDAPFFSEADLAEILINQRARESDESEPILLDEDGRETSPERYEKLKRGLKVIVLGPPHSGKSIFIQALQDNINGLKPSSCFVLSAAPDGEGVWLKRHYGDPTVTKYREKGQMSEAFVENRCEAITQCDGVPVVLVDAGGLITDENRRIAERCTNAVVLFGDLSKCQDWVNLAEGCGLTVDAKLHSHYVGERDLQLPDEETRNHLVGSVHHLERGEDAFDRETIAKLAQRLVGKADNNQAFIEAHRDGKLPFQINLTDLFAEAPAWTEKMVARQIKTPLDTIEIRNEARKTGALIPYIYEHVAENYEGRPVWFNGITPAWMAVALTAAFEDNGSQDIRYYNANGFGYVQTKELPISEDYDPEWWREPEQKGEYDGHPIYIVENAASLSTCIINPEDLDHLSVPALPEDAIVVISGKGPNWLKASITRAYKDRVHAIAAFQPGDGSTVGWTERDSTLPLGAKLENFLGRSVADERYLAKTSDYYLQKALTNFIAEQPETEGAKAEEEQQNYAAAIQAAYTNKNRDFASPQDLRAFIESLARQVAGDTESAESLIRRENSDEYPYTRVDDLAERMDDFYDELFAKIQDGVNPLMLATFAEYTIDVSGHFFAEHCAGAARVISSFFLMRGDLPLPTYHGGRAQYEQYAPQHLYGYDQRADAEEYYRFSQYYKTLFSE